MAEDSRNSELAASGSKSVIDYKHCSYNYYYPNRIEPSKIVSSSSQYNWIIA